jgi:hypothetical protein
MLLERGNFGIFCRKLLFVLSGLTDGVEGQFFDLLQQFKLEIGEIQPLSLNLGGAGLGKAHSIRLLK